MWFKHEGLAPLFFPYLQGVTPISSAPVRKAGDTMDGFTKEELEEDMKALEEEEKKQKQARLDHKIQTVQLFLESPSTTEINVR